MNKKTKTFEKEKNNTPAQGPSGCRSLQAMPFLPRASLFSSATVRRSQFAACRLPLAANCSLMAAAAAASRTRCPSPRPELQLRQAAPSSRATLLRPAAPPSRCTLLRSASPCDPAPAPPLPVRATRSCKLLLRPKLAPVCSARARRLQPEEDKRRRGKRIR